MSKEIGVKFSVSEMAKNFNFKKFAQKQKIQFYEFDKDGSSVEIKYPISGNLYLIEYDAGDHFSMAGCALIAGNLLKNGCRVFSSKGKIIVSTFSSYAELKEQIDELTQMLFQDDNFWGMVKRNDMLLKEKNLLVDNTLKSREVPTGRKE